ncbi:MAG: ISAzo13-like element transposase-related protein [Paraclostridium sp.]
MQFLKRIYDFSVDYNIKLIFACYPPYHSKYNLVERVWGILENH